VLRKERTTGGSIPPVGLPQWWGSPMTDESLDLTRRKVLGSIGVVGVAGAAAGYGTTAYFSDTESIQNNTLSAGALDLKVDWEEHYWDDFDTDVEITHVDSSEEVGEGQIGLPDPESPMIAIGEGDLYDFMDATAIEAFPDPNNDGSQEVESGEFIYDACADGADLDEDLDPRDSLRTNSEDTIGEVDGETEEPYPLVYLEDVKPGDFGELTLSFHLCDNPGYVWLQAENFSQSGGATTEPEPTPDEGELAEKIQTVWWYDSRGDNVLQTDCPETLYLTDSGTDPTTLYGVELTGGNAELTELWPNGDVSEEDFDQTDAIAATPNGDEVIFYDKETGHLGRYDVAGDSFTDEGEIDADPGGVVLAGFSASGVLWAASQGTDHLYTVDISSSPPEATDRGDTGIDLQGADLVFASDGTMYIWTAESTGQGLYRVDDPDSDPTAVPVDSSNIGNQDATITGLAIRDAGTGQLVASDRENDEIVVIDRTDGNITDRYPMTLDDEAYAYDFGDMTAGALCGEVFHRGTLADDLAALESGDGLPLDGNRSTPFDELTGGPNDNRECFVPGVSHYIGFAWWLPRDVGNEVQGDTVSFDLGFYTEQCRHNDSEE